MTYSRNNGAKGLIYLLIFFFLTLITYNVIYYNSTRLSSLNGKLDSINQKIKEIEQINDNDRAILNKEEKHYYQQKLEEQDRSKEEKSIYTNKPIEIARKGEPLKSNFDYTGLTTLIWQTSPGKVDEKIEELMSTWKQVPGWSYNLISNYAVKDHIRTAFPKLNVTKF
ncbi:hypothetical protein CONCODRAFT_73834 [Conidiobolus coronatus NRRL 28638]|uniref:Uncharacterized protein n=1 Tax=Conidiobolus coronatus (strain ATCC 28846 / CBS 209.66 / NRRL 28638) TaxID=796925 RepID=A0A137NUC1_CONC2|nr:hypothetical protein CONCODRAFT_73834 [Conidiobolus coronatus NRRL 28638]|eukprot:KXN66194.1 hypothetical protein CONCODRAFT_73834 [Conidiobolus coronatus NRRL 28638]